MFTKLRIKLGRKALRRLRAIKRPMRPLLPISYVESVGIVMPSDSQANFERIMEFMLRLQQQNKRVRLCTYSPLKEPPTHLVMRRDVTLLQRNDLAWNFKPQSSNAASFYGQAFDYLIDFSHEPILPLQWLVRMTKANMRVGFLESEAALYDIIFPLRGAITVEKQLKILNGYLNSPAE